MKRTSVSFARTGGSTYRRISSFKGPWTTWKMYLESSLATSWFTTASIHLFFTQVYTWEAIASSTLQCPSPPSRGRSWTTVILSSSWMEGRTSQLSQQASSSCLTSSSKNMPSRRAAKTTSTALVTTTANTCHSMSKAGSSYVPVSRTSFTTPWLWWRTSLGNKVVNSSALIKTKSGEFM